jgi:hypothetical protein
MLRGCVVRVTDSDRVEYASNVEASIAFEGTGAVVRGLYLPNGGKADVLSMGSSTGP